MTFEKVHWNVAGTVGIADVLTILFLAAFALAEPWAVTPRTTGDRARASSSRSCSSYLLGFFNLETKQALDQYEKGMVKFVLHFVFLACAVTYPRAARRALLLAHGRLVHGRARSRTRSTACSSCSSARAGHNLDHTVLSPLTGGASSINIYGSVNGASVYRPNALTGDPNHLGIMLDIPLLALTPVYLRLGTRAPVAAGRSGSRSRSCCSSCSRRCRAAARSACSSGCSSSRSRTGASCGRARCSRRSPRWRSSLAYVFYSRWHFFSVVISSRLQTGGKSTSAHFAVYDFVPHVLHSNPLFGLGLNTFSVYYEFVTGKTNWGPHSYWVALIVETGLVGALLFLVFLRYVFLRLRAARALGRTLDRMRDPMGARASARVGDDGGARPERWPRTSST